MMSGFTALPLGAAILLAASGPGLAQDCTCETTPASGQSALGMVISASGQVLASAKAGFTPVGPGAELSYGSHVVVGPSSFADISIGNGCAISLAAGAEAMIVPANDKICVRVTDPSQASEKSVVHETVGAVQKQETVQNAASNAVTAGQNQQSAQNAAQQLLGINGNSSNPFVGLLAAPAAGAGVVGLGAAALGGAVLLDTGTPVGGGGTSVSQ